MKVLDADLAHRDGKDHSFYAQFNTIDKIKHVVVAYENQKPSGCGAIKEQGANAMEIKRMYVSRDSDSTDVPQWLETWSLSTASCTSEGNESSA